MKLSLLIPVYNEEDILNATVDEIREYMEAAFPGEYEVIFINDGSSDASEEILKRSTGGPLRYVSYGENRGKGYAIRCGVKEALGDVILFTDCDLAYGTEVIKTFYDTLAAPDAPDGAVGSRILHKDGYASYTLGRKIVSRAYLLVLRLYGGLSLSDSQCGCKGFRREAAKRIFSLAEVDRFAFDFEAILLSQHLGMRLTEVPVAVLRHGKSSVRVVRDTLRMLGDLRRMKKRIKKIEK